MNPSLGRDTRFFMLGTIVNTGAIVIGTIVGTLLHSRVKDKYKQTLYDSLGIASLAIGLNASISNMKDSQYPVLFILSIAIGSVVGTRLDLDGRFRRLIERRTRKQPSQQTDDAGGKPSSSSFADGLITSILLYCIGPLSMLGPILSALKGDNTLLFTNATLDFVSSCVFASTYGLGMMLSAPVLFLWQGAFYMVAQMSSQAVSDALMTELLITGGLLITGSGLSLLNLKDCKTLNLLPSLLVPIVWFAIKALW